MPALWAYPVTRKEAVSCDVAAALLADLTVGSQVLALRALRVSRCEQPIHTVPPFVRVSDIVSLRPIIRSVGGVSTFPLPCAIIARLMADNASPAIDVLLETAIEAAQLGGDVLLRHWDLDRKIEFKGAIDLITEADRLSEQAVVSHLSRRFPGHGVLAEEGRTAGPSTDYLWIVDPLDGTTNYAHGYPHFAVSVALELRGELIVGVVHDPILRESFWASSGGGSYLNGRSIAVTGENRLIRSLLCTGFPYDRTLMSGSLKLWDHFVRRCRAVRRDGSAALDLCYVAAGRFDGFYEAHLGPWDMAAGVLIVREAGGQATAFDGTPVRVRCGEVVAANRELATHILAGIAECRAR